MRKNQKKRTMGLKGIKMEERTARPRLRVEMGKRREEKRSRRRRKSKRTRR